MQTAEVRLSPKPVGIVACRKEKDSCSKLPWCASPWQLRDGRKTQAPLARHAMAMRSPWSASNESTYSMCSTLRGRFDTSRTASLNRKGRLDVVACGE